MRPLDDQDQVFLKISLNFWSKENKFLAIFQIIKKSEFNFYWVLMWSSMLYIYARFSEKLTESVYLVARSLFNYFNSIYLI